MKKGIFLTIKDLMILSGSDSYAATAKAHKVIRDSMETNKKKLTIKEYCQYEKLDYNEIMEVLNNSKYI